MFNCSRQENGLSQVRGDWNSWNLTFPTWCCSDLEESRCGDLRAWLNYQVYLIVCMWSCFRRKASKSIKCWYKAPLGSTGKLPLTLHQILEEKLNEKPQGKDEQRQNHVWNKQQVFRVKPAGFENRLGLFFFPSLNSFLIGLLAHYPTWYTPAVWLCWAKMRYYLSDSPTPDSALHCYANATEHLQKQCPSNHARVQHRFDRWYSHYLWPW